MEVIVRILSIQAENFASYKELDFKLTDRGLMLIQGPTGSGKSTLCDLIPWALFGQTSKNGAADEVIAWNPTGPTKVTIALEYNKGSLVICRTRGKNANDLWFGDHKTEVYHRGKDLNDTQKLINNLLGLDANLYLSGAYFHEFSTTAQFFITTAKNRRLICEQIVDLSLAKTLQIKLSESKKTTKKQLDTIENDVYTLNSLISSLSRTYEAQTKAIANWQHNQAAKKTMLETKYDNFEHTKANTVLSLEAKLRFELTNKPVCPTCGANRHVINETPYLDRIKQEKDRVNPYLEQLAALELETNPGDIVLNQLQVDMNTNAAKLTIASVGSAKLNIELSDLETLEEITDSYRAITIQNAIGFIESSTNDLLNRYFDAEIQVAFEADSADKIEVSITKDANQCSYTQLSKGQRCLLKLCFGISIMKAVSNHSGVSFNQVFFDEALDGMDENLKTKSYRLLEALATNYESVFVVEHSTELKNLFTNKITVNLVNGHSELSE